LALLRRSQGFEVIGMSRFDRVLVAISMAVTVVAMLVQILGPYFRSGACS